MAFSHEDKLNWNSSEVMRELEKIAEMGGTEVPEEAYMPLDLEPKKEDKDEKAWEDEDKLIDATEELFGKEKEVDELPKEEDESEELIEGLLEANDKMLGGLEKLSMYLVDNKNVKAAYTVERSYRSIQALLQEVNNA